MSNKKFIQGQLRLLKMRGFTSNDVKLIRKINGMSLEEDGFSGIGDYYRPIYVSRTPEYKQGDMVWCLNEIGVCIGEKGNKVLVNFVIDDDGKVGGLQFRECNPSDVHKVIVMPEQIHPNTFSSIVKDKISENVVIYAEYSKEKNCLMPKLSDTGIASIFSDVMNIEGKVIKRKIDEPIFYPRILLDDGRILKPQEIEGEYFVVGGMQFHYTIPWILSVEYEVNPIKKSFFDIINSQWETILNDNLVYQKVAFGKRNLTEKTVAVIDFKDKVTMKGRVAGLQLKQELSKRPIDINEAILKVDELMKEGRVKAIYDDETFIKLEVVK